MKIRFFKYIFFLFLSIQFLYGEPNSIEGPYFHQIIFTSANDWNQIKKNNVTGEGIFIKDLWVPDENSFFDRISPFLGCQITMENLDRIKNETLKFYKRKGSYLINVSLPAGQDITNGRVIFLVTIAKLGEVKSVGANYFSNEKIKSEFRLKQGDYIDKDKVLADIRWVNQNPFRQTTAILEEGQDFGETDITLSTKDRRPWKVYGGYENTGNQIAGSSRLLAGFSWGNVFGLGHQFNYLAIASPEIKEWWAQTASYIIPLSWRNILEFNGSFTKTKPENIEEDFVSTGKSWGFDGKYKIPFRAMSWNHLVSFGYQFQRLNNFLTFAESLLFDRFMDISQFFLSYEGEVEYKVGKTKLGTEVFGSPGNMTAFNNTAAFEQEREGTKSNYIYGRARLEQAFFFPGNVSWLINSLYQQASGKLLPNLQFSLGGMYTVRGYDENEVISDNGILIRNEIFSPPIKLPPSGKDHQFQFLGFFDFGRAYDVNQNILSEDAKNLASVGPGIRYHFEDKIVAKVDYGWQLNTVLRIEDPSTRHSRVHVSVIVTY